MFVVIYISSAHTSAQEQSIAIIFERVFYLVSYLLASETGNCGLVFLITLNHRIEIAPPAKQHQADELRCAMLIMEVERVVERVLYPRYWRELDRFDGLPFWLVGGEVRSKVAK